MAKLAETTRARTGAFWALPAPCPPSLTLSNGQMLTITISLGYISMIVALAKGTDFSVLASILGGASRLRLVEAPFPPANGRMVSRARSLGVLLAHIWSAGPRANADGQGAGAAKGGVAVWPAVGGRWSGICRKGPQRGHSGASLYSRDFEGTLRLSI